MAEFDFNKIDWTDLRTQKTSLLKAIEFFERVKINVKSDENPQMIADLTSILHLIDALQDYAVDELGIPEMSVFDLDVEESREHETKEEKFARESAQRIFEYRIESDGVYVLNYDRGDKLIPRAFMERIFDDSMHADIIKAQIRYQILDDVKNSEFEFQTDDDGNYVFDNEMINDYGGVLEAYCKDQWAKVPKPQAIYCERCNEKLNPAKAVWLELSITDGKYYPEGQFPISHESQGGFSFGKDCARTVLMRDPKNEHKRND